MEKRNLVYITIGDILYYKEIMYTEEELEDYVKKAVSATLEGTLSWIASKDTWIQYKDTKDRSIDDKVEFEGSCGPLNKYIIPNLKKVGIEYKIQE